MRFCRKKMLLTMFMVCVFALQLSAWKLGETVNVQTLDGHFFPNAELMSVDDGGITICYKNRQNEPVLKGITFDKLTVELRVRYNYDPEKFAAYQKGVGTYRPADDTSAQAKTKGSAPKTEQAETDQDDKTAKTDNEDKDEEEEDDTPSLTVAPWDWYYSRTKYVYTNYPGRPPHRPPPPKPGPNRPGPHNPKPHKPAPKPGPHKPTPNKPVINKPAVSKPAAGKPVANRPVYKPAQGSMKPAGPASRPVR